MNLLRRQARLGLLALLIMIAPLTVLAQNEETIRIDGSRIVAGIVEPLSEAYAEETGANIDLEISGTSSGITRLCAGDIDIATAARPITRAEADACAENGVEWVEVLLGYDALAVIANPLFSFAECLTLGDLSTVMGPGAANTVTNWSQVRSQWEATPFVIYAPPTSDTTFNLLDTLLPGDGLRSDLNTQENIDDLINLVAEDVAGIGFAPLSAVMASDANVLIIALDDLSGNGCVMPEQSTLENNTYPAARGLYLYVNADSLEQDTVSGLVNFILGDAGREAIADNGFVTLSDSLAEQVQTNVADRVTGRQFSKGEPLYTIALDVSGSVTAETSPAAFQVLDNVSDELTGAYTGIESTVTAFGNPAAYRKLCNGEVDLASVTRTPTEEEAGVCEENGVSLWEVPLGNLAVVMLVPAEADFAACLTTEQVANLWQLQDEDTVTNWNQLGEDFPDLDLTIFLPQDGQSWTDFILFQTSGQILNPRRDALEKDNDALYRAAATANIEGAATYVTFAEYTTIDSDVMAVAIDAGDGCVEPSLETIRDGSYVLSRPVFLQINQAALARPEVQAVVWYTLRDSSASLLEDADVILLDTDVFEGYRETAVEYFVEAEAAAEAQTETESAPTEEPTPAEEGTGSTSDATPEATAESAQ